MYLSRIRLDTANRNTLRALNAPAKFHGAVESAFPGERKRRLWRLDRLNGALYLLLLSEEMPQLQAVSAQFCASETDCETKLYDGLLDRIRNGTVWRFRLTANPTRSDPTKKTEKRSKVQAHITTEYQTEWLLRRAEQHGFRTDSAAVTEVQWKRFYKAGQKLPVTLLSVTYEGILSVTDAAAFRSALTNGIGRGKAYGMGLMTVMRTKEACDG